MSTSIFTLSILSTSINFLLTSTFYDILHQNSLRYTKTLLPLSLTPFFRITKTDLTTPCEDSSFSFKCPDQPLPLNSLSLPPSCSLPKCDEKSIPFYLSSVNITEELLTKLRQKDNIWVHLNCDPSSPDLSLYDLEVNKEGYTGYSGKSAHKMWNFIHTNVKLNFGLDKFLSEITSGLHSSVSIHVSKSFPNYFLEMLEQRLNFKLNIKNSKKEEINKICRNERIKNLLILHSFLEYAVSLKYEEMLATFQNLRKSNKCNKFIEKAEIYEIIKLLKKLSFNKNNFLKKEIKNFFEKSKLEIKIVNKYKEAFIKIQKKLNCIECEKCKLWGKLQVHGIATAFSAILNGNKNKLTEEEIHWLVRTYIKTSRSVKCFYEEVEGKFIESDKTDNEEL